MPFETKTFFNVGPRGGVGAGSVYDGGKVTNTGHAA